MQPRQKSRHDDDPTNLGGNRLISGRWTYLRMGEANDSLRFAVSYIDPKGIVRKVYALSSFSHDIKNAMSIQG